MNEAIDAMILQMLQDAAQKDLTDDALKRLTAKVKAFESLKS